MTDLNLAEAKKRAEKRLGFEIDTITAATVLAYAARKCVANHKETSYLELLYETELYDYFARLAITAYSMKGVANELSTVLP